MADVNDPDALGDDAGGMSPEPKDLAVGVVPEGREASAVVDALGERGVDGERVHVLEGEDGRRVLDRATPDGAQRLVAWLSDTDELRQRLDDALAAGRSVVTVTGVDDDHEAAMRSTMADAGLEQVHFFGDWAAS